jgi:hypothetical protein
LATSALTNSCRPPTLPQIRERYSGLVITNLGNVMDQDYRGFDYLGLKYLDNDTPEVMAVELARMLEYAERDGARGVIITEMGWVADHTVQDEHITYSSSPMVGEAVQAARMQAGFDLSDGKVAGFFVISPLGAYNLRGRPAEEIVGRFFTGDPDFLVPEVGPTECGF